MNHSSHTESLTLRGAVYPWHCDHMGHMNVMWYTARFDEAMWSFFADLGVTPARMAADGLGVAAVEAHVRYLRELRAGQALRVHTRLTAVADKSITVAHRLMADMGPSDGEADGAAAGKADGVESAVMTLTALCLDAARRRARPWPDDIRAAMAAAMARG